MGETPPTPRGEKSDRFDNRMTNLNLLLTNEENRWLEDWSTMSGYTSAEDGIREVLKTCGAIPRGEDYWKKRFSFAE